MTSKGKMKGRPLKKQISPAKRWCFTWNNYPADWNSSIVPIIGPVGNYIIGKEVGESGTPHLQGYIEFHKKVRALSVGLPKGIHWEKAKGNRDSNLKYCSKDGEYVASGFRVPRPVPKMKMSMLRRNQKAISALFSEPEDPLFGRIIYWFWEAKGSWGKSICGKHLVDCRDAIIVGGKRDNILCGVASFVEKNSEGPPLVIFDIPRANGAHASFSAMESVKNGLFFSGKYESAMVRFNSPHCVVFANEEPDYSGLSGDRWRVRNLVKWEALMDDVKSSGKCTEVYWLWRARKEGGST